MMAGRAMAVPGAVAPATVRFDFWTSMGDLARLVGRSRAPGLKSRLAVALALVLLGKWTGVYAPLLLGKAINALAHGDGRGAVLSVAFFGLVVGYVVLRAEPVTLTTELPGRVSAMESSDVRPQINGVVRRRDFVEGGQVRRDRLQIRADRPPRHPPVFPNSFVRITHDAAGNRETDSFISSRLGVNKRIDSYHVPIQIHQRAAAVARIDRRISLDVHHRIFRVGLPRHRTD